ncbi:MAG: class I SAM-dependent methyltransferase [Chitinispirillaceae bacterium]
MNQTVELTGSRQSGFPSDELLKKYLEPQPLQSCPEVTVLQASRVFDFWEEWERECGCAKEVPFWAVVWPAAEVLARFVLDNPALVTGRRVLDLGCGSGIPAVASALAGASHVQANDIDPLALELASMNADLNGVSVEFSCCNLLESSRIPRADVILVADLFYNRSQSENLFSYLKSARSRGIEVLIADGNRPFAPGKGVELLEKLSVKVNRELEGVPDREVRILRML